MKHNHPPRTPFSTTLSRSARETELRIRSILSGPKKRPPLPFLALVFAACLMCGNLVSCQVAQAEAPDSPDPSASSVPPAPPPEEVWLSGTLLNEIVAECTMDEPFQELTEEEVSLIQNLPASELPRQAVDLYPGPFRGDFWRDILLPVAADEEADVTVYFVFGGMPAGAYRDRSLHLWGAEHLRRDGVVLRCGDRTAYFPLCWETNLKYSANPPLAVDDFDGDGQPEAMLNLAWGDGTGCYVESLYIFDLDTMTYTLPDYSDIPIRMTYAPDKTCVRLVSGGRELELETDTESWFLEHFQGEMEAYNQVRFLRKEEQMYCRLDFDFTCNTLGYLAWAEFPVIYENGGYKLGPAEVISNDFYEF